ncbi:MAG: UvrD-helicase domain-containing protein, partial [Parvularculaceae bacterium]
MNAASHIKETTLGQRLAADPALSAIVSANAGAGKTRVLTNRVARLLLAGEEPARILCITFTKAAAAEMAQRLFDLLGKWALSPNEKLQKDLASLDGDDRIRSPEELANARRLFARALETPGGLKIQTIHSFCESLLKRFPLEAGIAPGFSVIEDAEAALAAKTAVASVAGRADGAIKAAFERLLQSMNGGALKDLLEANVISRRPFARATEFGWDAFKNEAAEILGTTPGDESDEIASSLVAALQDHDLKRALDALDQSGGNPQKLCAKPLQTYLSSQSIETKLAALARLFRKSDGAPRESFGTKKTEEIDPGVEAILRDAQQVYLGYADRIRGADAYHDSAAFYDIVRAGLEQYESAKAARGALDFDDLILYSRRLLSNANDTQWVLYKLDAGIRHILLDEAQDTGPDSWDVIERPLEEFFSGETARKGGRTFFAVGDMKQSIYSFQGADAALFGEKQEALGKRIAAVSKYEAVTLRASFRTTDPVLRFVDELFRREEVVDNVSLQTPLRHLCTRDGAAGMVELWPLVERIPAEDGNPWDAPLDATAPDSPPRKLAVEIAETISGWLKREEILESKGRPIKPGDIMILVQSRKALFREIIRALGKKGVPVAGADKIALLED